MICAKKQLRINSVITLVLFKAVIDTNKTCFSAYSFYIYSAQVLHNFELSCVNSRYILIV